MRQTANDTFRDYVLDQLAELGATARPMFGGHGLYLGAEFFGILHRGRLYFRTDHNSQIGYLAHGMQPFRPNDRQTLRNYYEVPPAVLDDGPELRAWARTALAARPAKPGK
jgi:DNA transformation protein